MSSWSPNRPPRNRPVAKRPSFLPVPNSLDPGCPRGTCGDRGRRRGRFVERRILLGTRCVAQRGKAVVEIERGISHQRRGGIRLRTEGALQLIAPRAEHTGDSGEGKLLLRGGYLADLRGFAGWIENNFLFRTTYYDAEPPLGNKRADRATAG